ncbi:MAG: prohibitin family protein [Limnothrix sp. CACIAM 69d]|nr:MAG: prohibitin family protein [Limnothrix sp. CACIAM 69d]
MLTFFLMLLIGGGAAFAALKSDDLPVPLPIRWAVRGGGGFVAVFVALYVISRFVANVPTGSVGVRDSLGNVEESPLLPGLHFNTPFSRVVMFSTRLKNIQESIEATSQEGLIFDLNVSLQYRIDPRKVSQVYRTIGTSESEIVVSRFRAIVRSITALHPAESIYSTKRTMIAEEMRRQLAQQLEPLGFVVEAALLREVKLPETVQAAIQQKLKIEQESKQMEFVLSKTRQEAQRKQIEAQAIANYNRTVAQGLTNQVIQLKQIEAMQSLAESKNTKVIITNGNSPILVSPGGN